MSAPRLLPLLTVLRLWRSGALREAEIAAMAERMIALVEAALRAVTFPVSGSLAMIEDLDAALRAPPPVPPLGGWACRYTIDVGCGTLREHAAAVYRVAAAIRHGARAGHDYAPLPFRWAESRPPGVAKSDRSGVLESFFERRHGWGRDVEAVLLACDALATAEEAESFDPQAMDRAEGAVEELEAQIGAEAAHWWRRRLRDLQREREAST